MKQVSKTEITRKMRAVDADLVQDVCSEKGCGMSILVDKEDKASGRKPRCTACLMRSKIAKGELK